METLSGIKKVALNSSSSTNKTTKLMNQTNAMSCSNACNKMASMKTDFVACSISITCGVVYGIAAEKAKVYVPIVIWNQMLFSQYTMLKMFLTSVATSAGIFSFLSYLPQTRGYFNSARNNFASCLTSQTVLRSILGGAMIGVGMTLSGSCPGMVLVQVGTGTQHAVFTFAGCLTGALLYSVVHGYLPSRRNDGKKFVDELLSTSYLKLAVPFSLFLGGVAVLVDTLIPWRSEVMTSSDNASPLFQLSWSPIASGILFGSLQIPLVLVLNDTLGGSSFYCTLLAKGLNTFGLSTTGVFSYFNKFRYGMDAWWQVFYASGALLGGAISATLSGSWGSVRGFDHTTVFIGGVFLLFGARLASGCTSGHGISGMGLLAGMSLLVVPAMFGGGIAIALILS